MYKLRVTWQNIFSSVKLHTIDRRVHGIDPAWPVMDSNNVRAPGLEKKVPPAGRPPVPKLPISETPKPTPTVTQSPTPIPAHPTSGRTVHINPNVIRAKEKQEAPVNAEAEVKMRASLLQRKKELFSLQAKKLEMALKAVQPLFDEWSKNYLMKKPNTNIDTDTTYQMEKINMKIKEENIKVEQMEVAKQLEEVNNGLAALATLVKAPPVPDIKTPTALVSPTPPVMTVTPLPKTEKEQKPVVPSTVTERSNRDPRRRGIAAVTPRTESEVATTSVKKTVVSDTVSKDLRTGGKIKGEKGESSVSQGKESNLKAPPGQKSPVKVPSPPKAKTLSPIRVSRAPSPPRVKTEKARQSPKRERSPSRKLKRKNDKSKVSEDVPSEKKLKFVAPVEAKKADVLSVGGEKSSKGQKPKDQPAEDTEVPPIPAETHGDVDLRTNALPAVLPLPRPVSPLKEENELGLFGSEDTDMRVFPSLVEKLAAVMRRNKEEKSKEEATVDVLAQKSEPLVAAPPVSNLPVREEKLEPPPPPKLSKIPKKQPEAEEDKRKGEERKKREDRDRRSPKKKRERSPKRSPARKRERDLSPVSSGRSPILEYDSASRSPILRSRPIELSPRRRGWKATKIEEEPKVRDFDHRREREMLPAERGLIRHPPMIRPFKPDTLGRGGRRDKGGRRFREDDESADYIIEQAEQQLNGGLISNRQFSDIVSDVLRRRETRMIREAQKRDGASMPLPAVRGFLPPRPMRMEAPRPVLEPGLLLEPRPLLEPLFDQRSGPKPGPRPPPASVLPHGPIKAQNVSETHVINIDSIPREIRFYGETAVALMAPNDPREISFVHEDLPRAFKVGGQIIGELKVGENYKEMFYEGRPVRVRIGAPTKEIFIDGQGFEFQFGGPDVLLPIADKICLIGISGPRPSVSIGEVPRRDLIAGKTDLILNGEHLIPVYLDALEQKFQFKGIIHAMKFENAFQTVLFDGQPYRPNFGGLPTQIRLNGEAHYARFLPLPEGVTPGALPPMDMEPEKPRILLPQGPAMERPAAVAPPSPAPRKLDRIASSIATVAANARPATEYTREITTEAQPQAFHEMNVHDLFSKLMATGLVPLAEQVQSKEEKEAVSVEDAAVKAEKEALEEITFKTESLRQRRRPIIDMMYKGVQCNSCGLRFRGDQTCKYSQHLDWHFRQNRREKAIGRRPQARAWYYSVSDWLKFEEFGEEKGWLEGGEPSDTESVSSSPEPEVPTVPADNENPELNKCAVCREEIPQFFHEELEEWRLRDAVREDDKTFHSSCYEDWKSHGEKGLYPSLDVTVEVKDIVEDEKDVDVKTEVVEESSVVIKEEIKKEEEVKIKEEVSEELPPEVKSEKIEDSLETSESVVDTSVVVTEEISEIRRDAGTPIKDERIISPVPDIIENSETIISSIDGNTELVETTSSIQVPKIKLNISNLKPKEAEKPSISETESHVPWKQKEIEASEMKAESDELPPGEEPSVALKPRMMNRRFKQIPIVTKGHEDSGLCSIM
ncbi:hypothetical protein QYM36_010503 [Artemia franciscana]|nr:hypothetical protein QYM36_010503 [Artemia franciscana]